MLCPDDYKADPCGTLPTAYHKLRYARPPAGVRIVHARDLDPAAFEGFKDEPYFKLIHRLGLVEAPQSEAFFIRTAGEEDIPLIAEIIARSYTDIGISAEELEEMRSSPVFCPELWVIACEKSTGAPAACGIAELDREVGEGALEWIQTLPEFRRRGAARLVVLTLLSRLRKRAGFVTVSGRTNDPNSPEMLYRGCGFEGSDVWHVLRAKAPCTGEE